MQMNTTITFELESNIREQLAVICDRYNLSLEEAFELKSEHVSRQNENGSSGVKNEAVQALVARGYAASEALKALNGIAITDDMDVETLLKAALKNMAFL